MNKHDMSQFLFKNILLLFFSPLKPSTNIIIRIFATAFSSALRFQANGANAKKFKKNNLCSGF